MRLIKIGPNAHALETPGGALLFSYESLTAVRIVDPDGEPYRVYIVDGVMTTATRAHLQRFAVDTLRIGYAVVSRGEFARICREVLNANDGRPCETFKRAPYTMSQCENCDQDRRAHKP